MSLRIWLPLNGDLTNQGLDNVTVTNNGATINDTGKIGKCYSFDGTDDYISLPVDIAKSITGAYSVTFWVNTLSWVRNYQTVFAICSSGASWYQELAVFQRNGSGSTFVFNLADNTNGHQTATNLHSNTVDLNKWYHFACVYDPPKAYIYQDGVFVMEYTPSFTPSFSSAQFFALGKSNGGYQNNMLLNDFRLYDHALSAREIKEISKGLVLHYPLAQTGAPNLLYNTADFNWLQNNADTTVVIDNIDGIYVKTMPSAVNWYYIAIRPYISASIISGKTITVTCEIRGFDLPSTSTQNYFYLTLNAYQTTDTNSRSGCKDHPYYSNVLREGEWVTLSYQLDVNFNDWAVSSGFTVSDMVYVTLAIFNHSGKRIDIRHPKIEIGSKATPYIPNTSDAAYTKMGLNNSVEYDCSGFGNNGTKSGTITTTSDTPRYNTATHFNLNSGIFAHPAITLSQFTISFWAKHSASGKMLFGSNASLSSLNSYWYWYGDNSFKYPSGEYYYQYNAGSAASLLGTWIHFVATYNGSVITVYRNGVNEGTKAATGDMVLDYVSVGNGYYQTSYWAEGNVSDLRIYATCLSADDILALYNTPVSITSNGLLMTQGELSEV